MHSEHRLPDGGPKDWQLVRGRGLQYLGPDSTDTMSPESYVIVSEKKQANRVGLCPYLVTILSTCDSGTVPLFTPRVRLAPHRIELGIATSRPANAEAIPDCCAPQSETTKPWKPSSPLRRPLRSFEFWQACELFALL